MKSFKAKTIKKQSHRFGKTIIIGKQADDFRLQENRQRIEEKSVKIFMGNIFRTVLQVHQPARFSRILSFCC